MVSFCYDSCVLPPDATPAYSGPIVPSAGFTPQYKELAELDAKYSEKGLVILGKNWDFLLAAMHAVRELRLTIAPNFQGFLAINLAAKKRQPIQRSKNLRRQGEQR